VPLLVDEAHGAHLGLHPALPPSALQCGADLVVQSTHKQLSALTQAAMLHLRGRRVERRRVARALQVLQSSSPSYLLMSSLDAARAQAEDPAAHEASLAAAALARARLVVLPGVHLLSAQQAAACDDGGSSREWSAGSSGIALDPLRLTLDLRQLGLSGYEAAARLEQHGIVPELAGPKCVVLALSIGSTVQHAEALVAAVEALSQQYSCCSSRTSSADGGNDISLLGFPAAETALPIKVRMPPRDAFFAPAEAVPASAAVGRVSADLLCPYPPGIPAVYPGEVITQAVLHQLQQVLSNGGNVTGCSDSSLATLRVVLS